MVQSKNPKLTAHQRFEAEERFRAINDAYSLLMKQLGTDATITNSQQDTTYDDFRLR